MNKCKKGKSYIFFRNVNPEPSKKVAISELIANFTKYNNTKRLEDNFFNHKDFITHQDCPHYIFNLTHILYGLSIIKYFIYSD
ncbi:fatty acid synthase-like [Vespula maculifrons]|uniref:Fatty acid synthase-like n=1 Tax=Vespula maculifrons TaxID=7453 RepID=A0ABD2CTF8_VESMC